MRPSLIFTTLFLLAPLAPAQKQGAELLKTDILCVLAHPDDETGMASTLAYYAHGRGTTIAHVYCTRGEGGGNMVGRHWGASLGVLRGAELQQCLAILGVKHCFFLGQLDWAYTESAAMTLEKWDKEAALAHLVRLIRNLRPEIILTMNPFPRPGQHGHHQAAGMLAVEAYTAAADPKRFPKQLEREGIEPWQARKLYFRGQSVGAVARIDAGQPLPDGRNAHEIAGEALRNHRSQGFGRFRRMRLGRPPETFGLVKSVIAVGRDETDLLAGLPLPEGSEVAVIEPPPSAREDVTLTFRPRPAVSRFLQWAEEQEISHLVAQLPSDIPVAVGQRNVVTLLLANASDALQTIEVSLSELEGWHIRPTLIKAKVAAGGSKELAIALTPPRDISKDAVIRARGSNGQSEWRARATLHPVPSAPLYRIGFQPRIDATEDGWPRVEPIAIAPAQLVQGKIRDAADNSGEMRLGYDDRRLYVDLIVRDDVVVSNIAPNDIRGHWRSDSVEICIDPTGTSEHTLTCFKVGIFPFDETGATRAARDADAKQGPIEETAPGMVVSGARLKDGYRIQTGIPWETLGVEHPQAGMTLGFNVILYDGDKADAATGENINESRLAWSPRRGVQGRPEDWGRLRLE